MTIILMLVGAVMSYLLVAGFIFPYASKRAAIKHGCDERHGVCGDKDDHDFGAFLASMIWPLSLPWSIGRIASDRPSRTEKRHAKEISEAEHKAELARIKRVEEAETNRRLQLINQGVLE